MPEAPKEPIGAVLAARPWNFPFWQALRFAALFVDDVVPGEGGRRLGIVARRCSSAY